MITKKLIYPFLTLVLFLCVSFQTDKKTESFKVYGNCEMCKETIEGALKKKDGVSKKSWDTKSRILEVTYDPSKITLIQIKQKVSAAGYDTDDTKAPDEVYNNLHSCCQYKRPD